MPSTTIAISSSKEVKRLVNVENEIYSIKTKYPVTSGSIALTADDGKHISRLEDEKQRIVSKIIIDHTHHNDPCVCGSGRKFRKCCQNAF
jgi:uncharacterized protein YecA (UPF0149 family)